MREVRRSRRPISPLYYGKAFVYAIAAAPFVLLAGVNGLLLLHVLLLVGVFLGGYHFFAAGRRRSVGPLCYCAFLAASVTPLYPCG